MTENPANNYLEFEQPVATLEAQINELRRLSENDSKQPDLENEIVRLSKKCQKLKESIYASLTAWQISQIARSSQRPHMLDYIEKLFSDFEELHGDRQYADDKAIIGGIARFEDQRVAIVGHQKGNNTQEKVLHNFGMASPEGYRKALRIFKLAERFGLPILTFIDTPGAYPGIGAEERGQSRAIAENLQVMSRLRTPIISTVIGEGGSGGALAIGVCDCLLMLKYSIYSVISPEGCASILWKRADKAQTAAMALGITADRLYALGLIDGIVEEPLGGAGRDFPLMCNLLAQELRQRLQRLSTVSYDDLLQTRYKKLLNTGDIPTWV